MALEQLQLNSREKYWIDYIKNNVVSRLPGSASEKARTAAVVAWWALKEGILDLSNPLRHSLCGAEQVGSLQTCPGRAWQVGLSGIQPNAISLAQAESTAQRVYPGKSINSILRQIALDIDSSVASQVENSTGDLRKSWLLKDPAISFTIQRPFVETQCINGNASWCFGNWDTAKKYASSNARIRDVINTLQNYYQSTASGILAWALLIASLGTVTYFVAKEKKWIR
jgi:hypothetical protein